MPKPPSFRNFCARGGQFPIVTTITMGSASSARKVGERQRDMSGVVTTSEEFLDCLMRHQRRIYGFVYTLVPNRTDAEDILHDTVLVLWRKWADYDPRKGVPALGLRYCPQ